MDGKFTKFLNFLDVVCTVLDRKDCTPALLWSKTTLITGGVGVTGMDPPSCKNGKNSTSFLRSLALSVPIYRNFQLN